MGSVESVGQLWEEARAMERLTVLTQYLISIADYEHSPKFRR